MAKKDNEKQLRALEALAKTGNVLASKKKEAGKEEEEKTVKKTAQTVPPTKRGRKKKEQEPAAEQEKEAEVKEGTSGSTTESPAGEKQGPAPAPELESRKPERVKKCHASFLLKQSICDGIEKQAAIGLKENTKTAFIEIGAEVMLLLPPDIYFRLKTEAYMKHEGFAEYLASVLVESVKKDGQA